MNADPLCPPELARWLDAGEVQRLLAPQLGCVLGSEALLLACKITDTRFKHYAKPGSQYKDHVAVLLTLHTASETGGDTQLVHVKAYRGGYSAQAARAFDTAAHRPVHLEALDALCWRFPADPALGQLGEFADEAALMTVRARLPHAARIDVAARRVVNYRPGIRCTFEIGNAPESAFVKCYADDTGAATHARLAALVEKGCAHLRVTRPLGYDAATRSLWLERMAGLPLAHRLDSPAWLAWMRALGAGLAELHAHAEPGAQTWTQARLLEEVEHKVRAMADSGYAFVPLVQEAQAALHMLAATLPAQPTRAIHADLHLGQLLEHDGGIVFCDFDEVAAGHPAQDIGNFLVDLALRGVGGEQHFASRMALVEGNLAGGGEVPETEAMCFGELVALINRAYRAHLQRCAPDGEWVQALCGELGRRLADCVCRRATGDAKEWA